MPLRAFGVLASRVPLEGSIRVPLKGSIWFRVYCCRVLGFRVQALLEKFQGCTVQGLMDGSRRFHGVSRMLMEFLRMVQSEMVFRFAEIWAGAFG